MIFKKNKKIIMIKIILKKIKINKVKIKIICKLKIRNYKEMMLINNWKLMKNKKKMIISKMKMILTINQLKKKYNK